MPHDTELNRSFQLTNINLFWNFNRHFNLLKPGISNTSFSLKISSIVYIIFFIPCFPYKLTFCTFKSEKRTPKNQMRKKETFQNFFVVFLLFKGDLLTIIFSLFSLKSLLRNNTVLFFLEARTHASSVIT